MEQQGSIWDAGTADGSLTCYAGPNRTLQKGVTFNDFADEDKWEVKLEQH